MSYLQNFHYHIWKNPQKPKLVFLHGLLGSSSNWRLIASHFANNYEVLIYDQRGHGRSFHSESGYAPTDYAEDLDKILQELGWKKILLVGHSMGGRNAMAFALRFPEALEVLVIEDMGVDRPSEKKPTNWDMISAVPVPFPDRKAAKAYFTGPFLEEFAEKKDIKGFANLFYANMKNEGGTVGWRVDLPGVLNTLHQVVYQGSWGAFKAIQSPILLLRGEHSEDLSEAQASRMIKENKNVQYVMIPGVGHLIHQENPSLFIEKVEWFFDNFSQTH